MELMESAQCVCKYQYFDVPRTCVNPGWQERPQRQQAELLRPPVARRGPGMRGGSVGQV